MVKEKGLASYELPAGHIEEGERLLDAAKRELYEETGAQIYKIRPLGDYSVDDRYGRLYLAEVDELGDLPASEIEDVRYLDDDMIWTYANIQPKLLNLAEKAENIRPVSLEDASKVLSMMLQIDSETSYMMYEAHERSRKLGDMTKKLKAILDEGTMFVYGNESLEGYIAISRGQFERVKHTGYIDMGLKKVAQGQNIGSLLFIRVIEWAKANGLHRLELSVMTENLAGLKLYEKMGFVIEGKRVDAMRVDGRYVDEYYMAKILD